jgi:alkylhydroperoxidase family enzyme
MGGHSQFLVKELGLSQDEVERARAGEDVAALTEQQQVLIRFVRRLAERPRQINPDDVAALRAQGLDDATIVEGMSVCMMAAVTNTFADALKFDEDLERLGMRQGYF